VIEYAATRRGEMQRWSQRELRTRLDFHIPSRGLIGFRSRMLRATGGEIVMHHRFHQYEYFKGSDPRAQTGSIISLRRGRRWPTPSMRCRTAAVFFVEVATCSTWGRSSARATRTRTSSSTRRRPSS
jgi:GTP-binding protein